MPGAAATAPSGWGGTRLYFRFPARGPAEDCRMKWRLKLGAGIAGLLPLCAAWAGSTPQEALPDSIGFNRHVRPILSDKCYICHGPDANTRKAGLRLDLPPDESDPAAPKTAIIPGDPDGSEVIRRIIADNPNDQMPPADEEKQLTAREKEILRAWVAQGAAYEPHWSYLPPARPAPPQAGAAHPIDAFLNPRLADENLAPQPEADRRTLARRLYWDLHGMPPAPGAVDAFVNDTAPDAYEKLVEGLLASPHFGERMAMEWLDVVRYADSNGYHSDEFRSISAYRDYVIGAFNSNMPFDQFTREQLAGDLLPEPSRAQLIASGYNRLNQLTAEGGAQEKEYLAKYAADRVRTTATAWLGSTMGCAECHDHKYDPISAKDFYQFGAFFADIEEKGVYGSGQQWDPFMYLPTPAEAETEQALLAAIGTLESTLTTNTPALDAARAEWADTVLAQRDAGDSPWTAAAPTHVATQGETALEPLEDGRLIARGPEKDKDVYTLHLPVGAGEIRAVMLETFNHPELDGVSRGGSNFVLSQFGVAYRAPGAEAATPLAIASAGASYAQEGFPVADALNEDKNKGWAVDGHVTKADHVAIFRLAEPAAVAEGGHLEIELRFESKYAAHQIDCFRISHTGDPIAAATPWAVIPAPIQAALETGEGERTAEQSAALVEYFLATSPTLQAERDALAARRTDLANLKAGMETTLITRARAEPRVMRLLPRGDWLDESGEEVMPDTPAVLPALGVSGRRANRLDLANWIVREDNPLTARVTVNRLWKRFYGTGISKVLDDLGAQGEWPTHPRLLDWLATEFMESGWDTRHMVRLMVTSEAYRRASLVTAEQRARDPFNRLYARQARFRVDAESIRDGALAMSGLMATQVGGRSVFPYQPEGYYANCNTFGGVLAYDTEMDENQYRRGLYTFWKRSFLHPSLLAFDAPNREECTVDRTTSNTPLQALVLLNDPSYVEAARVFAQQIMAEGGERSDDRITLAYRRALSREPDATELNLMRDLYHSHLMEYSQDPEAAQALIATGIAPVPEGLDPADLAAWTSVTRVILNLHETITRS